MSSLGQGAPGRFSHLGSSTKLSNGQLSGHRTQASGNCFSRRGHRPIGAPATFIDENLIGAADDDSEEETEEERARAQALLESSRRVQTDRVGPPREEDQHSGSF